MDTLKDQLVNTWLRNQKANEQVIEALADDLTGPARQSFLAQFAHIHTIRYYNIEKLDKGQLNRLQKLSGRDKPDKHLVVGQLRHSCEAVGQLIRNAPSLEKIKGYKNGYVAFVAYLINHESHHRSKAMMILKQNGVKFSKVLKFDLWNWK